MWFNNWLKYLNLRLFNIFYCYKYMICFFFINLFNICDFFKYEGRISYIYLNILFFIIKKNLYRKGERGLNVDLNFVFICFIVFICEIMLFFVIGDSNNNDNKSLFLGIFSLNNLNRIFLIDILIIVFRLLYFDRFYNVFFKRMLFL